MPDPDRGFDGGVGYDDAAEGAERGEGIEGRGRAQEGVDALEVRREECREGIEVLGEGKKKEGLAAGAFVRARRREGRKCVLL